MGQYLRKLCQKLDNAAAMCGGLLGGFLDAAAV
jgi:hypothetical protein